MRQSRRKQSGRRRRNSRRNWKAIGLAFAVVLGILLVIVTGFQGVRYFLESDVDPDDPIRGVDVSSYQGDVDWKEIRGEGYDFAFVKATEGSTHVDPSFEVNWKKARRARLLVGAYHFLSYDSDGDTQAENFIRTVPKKRNALPPVVDVELYGDYETNHPDKEYLREVLDEVITRLEDRYGKRPIIYTNPYVYDLYLAGDYESTAIWISDPDEAETLSDGKAWTFCQYSFEGRTEGVENGVIDLNRYAGSLWSLRHLK